ncbi:hypothetical protein [Aeromicrobium sp. UC242_57]|uniref:hypothetical protein n=1 Tax=Aeromicrobium sp. UC242_57 TaxID=3374624 RepID=UPI0037B8C72B
MDATVDVGDADPEQLRIGRGQDRDVVGDGPVEVRPCVLISLDDQRIDGAARWKRSRRHLLHDIGYSEIHGCSPRRRGPACMDRADDVS